MKHLLGGGSGKRPGTDENRTDLSRLSEEERLNIARTTCARLRKSVEMISLALTRQTFYQVCVRAAYTLCLLNLTYNEICQKGFFFYFSSLT